MEYEDMERVWTGDQYYASEVVRHIRASLKARLEGRNEGGDTEVMRLVDEIVKREQKVRINPTIYQTGFQIADED